MSGIFKLRHKIKMMGEDNEEEEGTLSVTGIYKHGIFSNDYIRVRGGTLNVNRGAVYVLRRLANHDLFCKKSKVITLSAAPRECTRPE